MPDVEPESGDGVVPPVKGKQNRPGTFKKGDDPRRHDLQAPERVLVPDENPDLLTAIRWVLAHPKAADDTTVSQSECRKWLKQDRKGFMSKWADLEKASKVVATVPGGGTVEPEGPDSLEELATQLLADMEGEPWENE